MIYEFKLGASVMHLMHEGAYTQDELETVCFEVVKELLEDYMASPLWLAVKERIMEDRVKLAEVIRRKGNWVRPIHDDWLSEPAELTLQYLQEDDILSAFRRRGFVPLQDAVVASVDLNAEVALNAPKAPEGATGRLAGYLKRTRAPIDWANP